MSFVIAQSASSRFAGWQWPEPATVAGPLRRPWVHLGDGTPATVTATGPLGMELVIPGNFATTNGGGESYEYQAFTKNWGLDIEIWNPVSGNVAQAFAVYMCDSWSTVGPSFNDVVGVQLMHRPLAGGDDVLVYQFSNPYTQGTNLATWDSPVAYNGNVLTLRIWIEDDQFMRVWLNGTYLGGCTITPGYKLGPGRRSVRFLNTCNNNVWIRRLFHYDRPATFPAASVFGTTLFTDTFNGRTGNQNGVNGWTQLGNNAAAVGDAWATTGTTDGNRGLIRDILDSSGRLRVEGRLISPTSKAASLVLLENAAGSQGLLGSFQNDQVLISRHTNVLSSASLSGTALTAVPDTTIGSQWVSFSIYENDTERLGWLERSPDGGNTWERVAWTMDARGSIPLTNTRAGLHVGRASFANSGSWDEVRIKAA